MDESNESSFIIDFMARNKFGRKKIELAATNLGYCDKQGFRFTNEMKSVFSFYGFLHKIKNIQKLQKSMLTWY